MTVFLKVQTDNFRRDRIEQENTHALLDTRNIDIYSLIFGCIISCGERRLTTAVTLDYTCCVLKTFDLLPFGPCVLCTFVGLRKQREGTETVGKKSKKKGGRVK
jgi:hypothetical protein